MSTYFGFSDECGDYILGINERQLKTHPYYIRSTLIINSFEWKKLNNLFKQLKIDYGLPIHREIKWAYLWQLRKFQRDSITIPDNEPFKSLETYDYHKLLQFIDDSLNLINQLDYKKIILTYTDNSVTNRHEPKYIFKFHIQEMMQRIEMDLQHDYNNLAVIFIDPVNEERNKYFREIYFEIFATGDIVNEYNHIKDSINLEFSHHSVGIQIADYVCGAFSSILKCRNKENYGRGIDMFFKSVFPNIRTVKGKIHGFGIREVPQNATIREYLIAKIEKLATV
jgi:hypothetical protein